MDIAGPMRSGTIRANVANVSAETAMQKVALVPQVHLFVCANRRASSSPLGPGCGPAGEALFSRLKAEVLGGRAPATVWVTETKCLGICPKRGATVAIYPNQTLLSSVEADDAPRLLARALGAEPGDGRT